MYYIVCYIPVSRMALLYITYYINVGCWCTLTKPATAPTLLLIWHSQAFILESIFSISFGQVYKLFIYLCIYIHIHTHICTYTHLCTYISIPAITSFWWKWLSPATSSPTEINTCEHYENKSSLISGIQHVHVVIQAANHNTLWP